ncbi:MAG: PAC2 family protein [Candidatus Nanoarchaeia archaeon]|nr:PAC2 family protein [Candidatus Nanoarchaeia archaeon]
MEFRIKQFRKPIIKQAIMITGFPGIGNVGKIAIDFLIDHLKPVKIMEIESDSFPHSVFVTEQGLLEMPSVRLYYKKVKNNEFIFVSGDAQPVTEEACYAFCNKLLSIAKELKVKEIITMGGIGLGKIPKKPKVYIAGNNKNYIKGFPNCNIKIYGVVGPIMGVTGVLAGMAKDMLSAVILSQTFAHPVYLGVKGAKEILAVLNQKYGFKLDIKKIADDINGFEEEMVSSQEQLLAKPNKGGMTYFG